MFGAKERFWCFCCGCNVYVTKFIAELVVFFVITNLIVWALGLPGLREQGMIILQDFGKVVCSYSTSIFNGYYKTNYQFYKPDWSVLGPDIPVSKAIVKMMGVDLGPVRLPLEELTPQAYNQLQQDLKSIGFL